MAANENLLPPATSPPSQAAPPPPLSSRTAPPLSSRPAPPPEAPPAPSLDPLPPVNEPATSVARPAPKPLPETEPLFTIKVWQLGLVLFVVLLALLYVLGIL